MPCFAYDAPKQGKCVFGNRARSILAFTFDRLSVRARAGLEDVRLHDLLHSFASRALALGESLPMMGLLKNPSSDRGECRTMRQRPLGGWFGCWGRDGLLGVPFRRLGVPRWPTGRHEGRRQAA